MTFVKKFDNGLRLIIEKIDGLLSVSTGVLVKTGSVNESKNTNGISHFIEHVLFKGTDKRSAFEISDYIDTIGASINAFTSKEVTCYYTKSTYEHTEETMEVLSDLFFNSKLDSAELEKEKGVIIEEINMSEDTPEDLLFNLLAENYYGKNGFGQSILGPEKNIKKFTKEDALAYMDKYYTADNVVISVAGNVDVDSVTKYVEKYFVNNFKRKKSAKQFTTKQTYTANTYKYKKIEQCHVGLAIPGIDALDDRYEAVSAANIVLGGGMSSRLFQKIREEMGLAYSVYSYSSAYKDQGVIEFYAGVNPTSRDKTVEEMIKVINTFTKDGVTEKELLRGKEQMKSSLIMGRESTSSQMLTFGKYLLLYDQVFNIEERMQKINELKVDYVNKVIKEVFKLDKVCAATVGPKRKPVELSI